MAAQRTGPFDVRTADERTQLEAFLEEYRASVRATLDGLSEEQARRRLVPSATTLLGLLKHLTFVENVWFNESVTGTPRAELGPPTPDASFTLGRADTIESVLAEHDRVCEASREHVAAIGLDDALERGKMSPFTLRWACLQVLREYTHHCGHADILREQVLAQDEA